MERTGGRRIDHAYTAGFLDGEGCFRFLTGPRVEASSIYREILCLLADTYGGTVAKKHDAFGQRRTAWVWSIHSDACRKLIESIRPWLVEKAPQADLLLRGHRYAPKSAMRLQVLRELKALKRIHYQWAPQTSPNTTAAHLSTNCWTVTPHSSSLQSGRPTTPKNGTSALLKDHSERFWRSSLWAQTTQPR